MPGTSLPSGRQAALPVRFVVNVVRPLYALRNTMMSCSPVCIFASMMAVSLASLPELVKYDVVNPPGAFAARAWARRTMFS